MSDRRASDVDRLDRMLQACDPIGGRVPDGAGMAAAFDSMSALIVSEPRRAPRLRRFATRHRAALAGIAAALLGSGVAVAATDLFVPTHTHQYPPQGMVTGKPVRARSRDPHADRLGGAHAEADRGGHGHADECCPCATTSRTLPAQAPLSQTQPATPETATAIVRTRGGA